MHPRPDWFKLLKYAVLKLIVCTGVATFTYSGYFIPIFLGRIRVDFQYIPMERARMFIAVVLLSIIFLVSLVVLVCWLFILAVQFVFVNAEEKICCGMFALSNIAPALLSIMFAVDSGPIGIGQFWDIVGQWYIWLLALLHGLLPIAMALYWLALVWLDNQAQSSGGTVDRQPMAVVVIPGTSTSGGTHATRAAPGSAAAPGSTAASSAT